MGAAMVQEERRQTVATFILFLEKFIDKYYDFIQFFNTHMISFFSDSFRLSICLSSCLSVCLPVCLSVSSVWEYIWDESQHISARDFLKKIITLLVAQWVGMTVNHLQICIFILFLFCPARSSKRWLLFENMASVPSESVKRSLSLSLFLSSPFRPSLTVKGLVDTFYFVFFVTDGTDDKTLLPGRIIFERDRVVPRDWSYLHAFERWR